MGLEDTLRFANLVSSGLAAGVLLTFVVGIIPSARRLPDGMVLALKQTGDPLIDRFNPPAIVLSFLSGILILLVADGLSTTAVVFGIAGVAGSAGAGATSIGVNMPINRTMRGWSSEAPPPEFGPMIKRWGRAHRIRTSFGVAAFACYVVAALAALD